MWNDRSQYLGNKKSYRGFAGVKTTVSDFCTKGHQLDFQWMTMGEKGDDLLKVGRRNSSCEYLK